MAVHFDVLVDHFAIWLEDDCLIAIFGWRLLASCELAHVVVVFGRHDVRFELDKDVIVRHEDHLLDSVLQVEPYQVVSS